MQYGDTVYPIGENRIKEFSGMAETHKLDIIHDLLIGIIERLNRMEHKKCINI